ncbi:MAG: DUF4252 domain-containing protein [Bacteroidota bacterium]
MNRILSMAALLLMFVACKADAHEAMTAFYSKHKSDTHIQQISIPRFLIQFCADDPDLKSALKYMKSLRVFVMDASTQQRKLISQDLKRALESDAYGDVLEVSEADEKIRILIREEKDLIRNVIITIENDKELLVLQANTKMTYDDLHEMLGKIQTDKSKSGLHELVKKSEG